MPEFRFKALNANRELIRGRLFVEHYIELEARLAARSCQLIAARRMPFSLRRWNLGRLRRRGLIDFCFHLEQLLKAGVPLLDALKDINDCLSDSPLRQANETLIEDIVAGKAFSQALACHPHLFDAVFVGLVRAGEVSGRLPEVLRGLIGMLSEHDELISRTKSSLLYPAFAALIVLGALLFVMLNVVPQLVVFIRSMNDAVPLSTQALVLMADFLRRYGLSLLPLPLIFSFAIRSYASRDAAMRRRLDAFKLRIWVAGPILQKLTLARAMHCFALMYEAGVSVLDCLEVVEGVVANRFVADAFRRARTAIERGESLAVSFEQTEIFPRFVVRMVRVGEGTGNLDHALLNTADFYMREVRQSAARVQAMVEPSLTLVLGLVLGWIMISVFGPIYDVIGQIGF